MGVGMATGVYKLGSTSTYNRKLAALPEDFGYLCLAASLFGACVAFANFYPMAYKARIMEGKDGNLRANMYIYKTVDEENKKDGNYVVLEEKGDTGKDGNLRANMYIYKTVDEE